MTDIHALTEKTAVDGTDEIEVQETGDGNARKVTADNLVGDRLNAGTLPASVTTLDASDEVNVVKTSSGAEVELLEVRNNATANNTASRIKFVNSTVEGSNSGSTELVATRTSGNIGSFTVRVSDVLSNMQDVVTLTSDVATINAIADFEGDTRIDSSGYIRKTVTSGALILAGDSSPSVGPNIQLYGSTHASLPDTIRARIDTGTKFEITNNDIVAYDSFTVSAGNNAVLNDGQLRVDRESSNNVLQLNGEDASYSSVIAQLNTTRVASATGFDYLVCYSGGYAATNLRIRGDGDIENVNNSYGAISDEKLKQDIELAGSQVDDIREIAKIVSKFRLIEQVKEDPDAHFHIGLVAQQLEAISPGLILETEDRELVVIEPAQEEVTELQPLTWQKPVMVDNPDYGRPIQNPEFGKVISNPDYDPEDDTSQEFIRNTKVPEMIPNHFVPEQIQQTKPKTILVEEEIINGVLVAAHETTVQEPQFTTENVLDENGEVVMRPVVLQKAKKAVTEMQPNGEFTKTVKYSILYMKCVKALGELIERVEALEA